MMSDSHAPAIDYSHESAQIQHVVWDWNGTLVDDVPQLVASVNAACKEFGFREISESDYRRLFTRPIEVFYELVAMRPLSISECRRFDEIIHERYAALVDQVLPRRDAPSAVELAYREGLDQSILSMWFQDPLVQAVRASGCFVDETIVTGRIDWVTTKHELLPRHLERIGANPEHTIVIGDIVDDAIAASRCGLRAVLVAGGAQASKVLRSSGYLVVDCPLEAVNWIVAQRGGPETSGIDL